MRFYGSQRYKMAEAARAYAENYEQGDKFRIRGGNVEALRSGKWEVIGDVRNFADRWHDKNPPSQG